jgi:two-component system sensor histidine kinase AlgZ
VTQPQDQCYLPDFCSVSMVLILVLAAELLALALALASGGGWTTLAMTSLFMLWVVLASAALLCALRSQLARRGVAQVSVFSLAVVLAVTLATSVAGQILLPSVVAMDGGGPGVDLRRTLDQLAIAGIFTGIALRYAFLQQQLREQRGAELQARIVALQARIRPHFLFNSMNTIASLIATDPDLAERVVEDLSDLFRQSLSSDHTQVPMTEELELCRRFARIEALRLGSRLQVEWAVEALPPQLRIPRFTLQPLLENAIYHGVQPLPEGGVVQVSVRCDGATCSLNVVNPVAPAPVASGGHSMALDNIRHRLQALYGSAASLAISRQPGRFAVQLRFPCAPPADSAP